MDARTAAFEALNRSFDRIFVVTLARAKDRQARVTDRLAGLDFAFHLGADKRELDFAQLERDGIFDPARARAVSRTGKPIPPGHVGCSLSHRQIYEATLKNGWKRVLVFEDDVIPRLDRLHDLPAALAELPAGWELFYLGFMNFVKVTAADRAKQLSYLALSSVGLMRHWSPGQVRRLLPTPFSPHLRRAGLHHGTHAYAFTTEGARKLLEAQTPLAFNADQLLIHLILRGELDAYAAEPGLFDQEDVNTQPGAFSFIHE